MSLAPQVQPKSEMQMKPEVKSDRKPTSRKRKQKWRTTRPGTQKGSEKAKRTAAAILEVLAGARSPSEAAEAIGVSASRYYMIEAKALQGLVSACEPAPVGPRVSPEKESGRLRREVDRLKRDVARYSALARTVQRSVGLSAPKPEKRLKGGRKRRRRKPVVRALKAAAGFRAPEVPATTEGKE
jgi:hypothetical protein